MCSITMFLVTHMLLFQTYVKILITLVLLKMMFLVAQRRGLRPNGVPYERFVFLIVAVTVGPFDVMIIRCIQDCWAGWLCLCFLGVDNKHIHWGVPWGGGVYRRSSCRPTQITFLRLKSSHENSQAPQH